MADRYPIPAARHEVAIEVQRSRFIAVADRAAEVAEARALLHELRAAHPSASHHVHAFRVGFGASLTEGMSDDGEPPGTAGRPSLAVLAGSGLGDVCLVTVRYFGGTKLGTGGLVRAYTQAAQAVLEGLPRAWRERLARLRLTLAYPAYEPLRRLLDPAGAQVVDQAFGTEVALCVELPAAGVPGLVAAFEELTAGRGRWEPAGEG